MPISRSVLAAFLAMLAPFACATAAEVEPSPSLKSAGVISFCTELGNPPAGFIADDGSTPVGFEVDLMKEIGGKLGLRTDIKNYGFSTIFAALDSGKCDAVMSSTSKNPERLKKYAFVDYVQQRSGMLVKIGNPLHLQGWEDLSGHRVAVLLGSANERRLKEANTTLMATGKPTIEIVSFPTNTVAYQQLEIGRVDALASGSMTLAFFMTRSGKKLEMGGQPVPPTTAGIMVSREKTDTVQAVRSAVTRMIDDGTIAKVAERWGVTDGVIVCTKAAACD